MKSKLFKNYLYNMAYQILLIISPVITMPFLARSLGAEGIGQYSYAYTLTSYFVLFATLGCDIYGRREISYVKENLKKRSERFWSIELVKIISTIATLIVYLIFSFNNKNRVLLIILMLHLINVPLNIGWYYQGIERFKTLTIRGFALKIVDLLFVILFIHEPGDLNLYVAGSSFIAFITFFALWIDLRKTVCVVQMSCLKMKYDMKNCIVFFLPSIAATLYTLVDKTMLGIFSTNYLENGYYEQALKINQIFLRIVVAFGTVLLPQIAYFHKQGNNKAVEQNVRKSLKYVYLISIPMAFGLSCISYLFVPWFFGNEFVKVAVLLNVSGFILIFQGMSDVLGMEYLVSVEQQDKYTLSLVIGTIINLVLNLICIRRYQSVGVIYASLLSEIIIVGVQMFFVHKRINICHLLFLSKNYLIAGIIMFVPIKILSKYLAPTIINTIFVVIMGGTIYFIVLCLLNDSFTVGVRAFMNMHFKTKIGKRD